MSGIRGIAALLAACAGLWACATIAARAQMCEPRWSDEFHMGDLNGRGRALAWFDDGSGPALYVGGAFTAAGNVPAAGIARWDGEAWSAVGEGVSGEIEAMIVHDDGSGPALFIAGPLGSVAGQPAPSGVARWDGSSWTPLPGETAGTIQTLEVFGDGAGKALFVGGEFSRAGGAEAANIARWDGTSWSGLGVGTGGPVLDMEVFDDGAGPALFVGGWFESAGGISAEGLARWTGARWETAPAPPGTVTCLSQFDQGSGPVLYAGGRFRGTGLARLQDGVWHELPGSPRAVVAIGPIEVDGQMSMGAMSSAGVSVVGAQVGEEWRILGLIGTEEISDDAAMLRVETPWGERTYLTGPLVSVGAAAARGIAQWDGAAWSSLTRIGGIGRTYTIFTASVDALHSDGEQIVLGGDFFSAGSAAAIRAGVLDETGWSGLGAFWVADQGCEIFSEGITVKSIREVEVPGVSGLVACGNVGDLGRIGTTVFHWDGTQWKPIGEGLAQYCTDCCSSVDDIGVFDDGRGPALYVTGEFDLPEGSNVARWNGERWVGIGDYGLGRGKALLAHDDGVAGPALYAGGAFGISRWNGDQWSSVGGGLPPVETLIEVDEGGAPVLLAGSGHSGSGQVYRWDGHAWTQVGADFNSPVLALTMFDDGNGPALYAGGAFTLYDGRPVHRLAKWNGDRWVEVAGGVAGPVHALATVVHNGVWTLMVGGQFLQVGDDLESVRIARLIGCKAACPADCDGDGDLTFFDFLCFQNLFTAADPAADCDGSGALDFADFLCYQNAFAAGCP